jgi:Domain of unknown function (DUF1917)
MGRGTFAHPSSFSFGTMDLSTPVAPTEAHSTPPITLQLSVTRTWGNRTLPVNSLEWRKLRDKILKRDNYTCASCSYTSPHPNGRGLKIDHRNGDASDNDDSNLRVHCPACEAIRHCGLAGMKGWVQLARSDMDQVEILRKTREIFEKTGVVPRVREVDPLATRTEMDIINLANKLLKTDREELTDEEKFLRGFFTSGAKDLFEITMVDKYVSWALFIGCFMLTVLSIRPQGQLANTQPLYSSDARALEILKIEENLPWIRFSPESHPTLNKFFDAWPPSTTSQSEIAWICVDNGHPQPADDDKDSTDRSGLDKAWDEMGSDHQPTIADLDGLAQRFTMLGGKWLVFAATAGVDALWRRIATATHAGTLGTAAKVSPRSDSGSHVICVFTRNYTDADDVHRVRNGLRRLGVKGVIGYKPDIYTHCRVYSNNPWGIPPTRYRK